MIRRAGVSAVALAGGTLVFLGVYGHARPGDLVFGLVAAGAALALSRKVLPGRPRDPERAPASDPGDLSVGVLASLAAETLWSVLRDSWRIGRTALGKAPPPEAAFVEVPVGGRGETLLGILGFMETIPPGSYLVDVDLRRGTAVFHAFDAADAGDVRRRQGTGLAGEARSREDREEPR